MCVLGEIVALRACTDGSSEGCAEQYSRHGRASGLPAAANAPPVAEQARHFIEASGAKPTANTNSHVYLEPVALRKEVAFSED